MPCEISLLNEGHLIIIASMCFLICQLTILIPNCQSLAHYSPDGPPLPGTIVLVCGELEFMLDCSGGEIDASLFQFVAVSELSPYLAEVPATIWAVGPLNRHANDSGWVLSVVTCDRRVSMSLYYQTVSNATIVDRAEPINISRFLSRSLNMAALLGLGLRLMRP
jgi:hypothetical protein